MQFAIPFIKVAGNPSGSLSENTQAKPFSPSTSEVDVGQEEATLPTEDFASEIASPEITSPEITSPEIGSPAPPTQQDKATPGPSGTRGPHGHPIRKRKLGRPQGDAEEVFADYFAAKKAKLAGKEGCSREQGIKHFLMSLLPDLIKTNDVQLRKFKRKALELVEEVCENPVEHFVPPQSYPGLYEHSTYTVLAPSQLQLPSEHSLPTEEGSF